VHLAEIDDRAPATDTPTVLQTVVNTLSQPFQLFTDEQQTALEDDHASEKECHLAIYGKHLKCSDHHQQLLDALQIGNANDTDGLFIQKLNHTLTTAGTYTLWKWLEHPLYTTEDILLRRTLRETLVSNTRASHALRISLSRMEQGWKSLCWCWNDELSKTELVDGLLFTGMMTPLNGVPLIVNTYHFMRVCGTPLLHCLAPLVPVLLSYGALRWMGSGMSLNECWDMSTGVFKNALWFDNGSASQPPLLSSMMQGGGGGGSESTAGLASMMSSIHTLVPKMMKCMKWVWWAVFLVNIVMMVHQCYRHYKLLAHVYRRTHQACSWIHHAHQVVRCCPTAADPSSVQPLLDQLGDWAHSTPGEYSLTASVSDFLNAYLLLRQPHVRTECNTLLCRVGVMDALQSVDTLLQRESSSFSVPEVVLPNADPELPTTTTTTTNQPILELHEAYHPLLNTQQTKHTFSLDKHIVLTGSNASGKSTVLKTMLLNVLLAQSWGIVCATQMRWTPFATIRGYLYTTDECGRESLFQAQIRRIEEFIQEATAHKQMNAADHTHTGYSLLIVDEILNSTNPIEAMLLSYQYARTIGSELSDSSRMVMTTHYPVLTTLADNHPEFANWAMQQGYTIGVNTKCETSSAIGTVRKMTKVLGEKEHACLEKAYKRMFKKLAKMQFKELDGDGIRQDTVVPTMMNGVGTPCKPPVTTHTK